MVTTDRVVEQLVEERQIHDALVERHDALVKVTRKKLRQANLQLDALGDALDDVARSTAPVDADAARGVLTAYDALRMILDEGEW